VDIFVRTNGNEVTRRQRTDCGSRLQQLLEAAGDAAAGGYHQAALKVKVRRLAGRGRHFRAVQRAREAAPCAGGPLPRPAAGMQQAPCPVPAVPGYELVAFVARASSSSAAFGEVLRGCLAQLEQGRQVVRGSALRCDAWVGQARKRLRGLPTA
jgi:hypothetical protein